MLKEIQLYTLNKKKYEILEIGPNGPLNLNRYEKIWQVFNVLENN